LDWQQPVRRILESPLERLVGGRLLCGVPDDINSPVAAVGGIVAAATTGALIAMGSRIGSAGLPFAAVSALVFHRTVASGAVGLVFTGFVLHVAGMFLWSFVFVWMVEHYVHREAAAAVLVAVGQFILSGIITWATGQGVAGVLPLGDRIVFAVVLAVSLVVGIRLAFPRGATA
jgi:hypothetical protein